MHLDLYITVYSNRSLTCWFYQNSAIVKEKKYLLSKQSNINLRHGVKVGPGTP